MCHSLHPDPFTSLFHSTLKISLSFHESFPPLYHETVFYNIRTVLTGFLYYLWLYTDSISAHVKRLTRDSGIDNDEVILTSFALLSIIH